MAIDALPTPAPTRSDPANFAARSDAYHVAIITFVTQANVLQADVNAKQTAAATSASAAQADRIICAAAVANPAIINAAANAAAAAQAKLDAQAYATLAQATNPESPIRLNPRIITATLTIAGGYNAASVGPITLSDGVTATIANNATWSIH